MCQNKLLVESTRRTGLIQGMARSSFLSVQGELQIVYSDAHLVVVNKPSGMLAVPGKGENKEGSVMDRVKELFEGCISHPTVHRLDMDTSGIMVLALTKEAQRHLSIQFQNRTVSKTYLALLNGKLDESFQEGRIELPFRLDVENRPLQIYDPEHGKVGVTEWRRLEDREEHTLVEFKPITGRTHQLRVHACHEKGLGMPIFGDTLYGGHSRHGELKLHATQIIFTHPETAELMEFSIPPSWWCHLLS